MAELKSSFSDAEMIAYVRRVYGDSMANQVASLLAELGDEPSAFMDHFRGSLTREMMEPRF